jgi:hypothetical protein
VRPAVSPNLGSPAMGLGSAQLCVHPLDEVSCGSAAARPCALLFNNSPGRRNQTGEIKHAENPCWMGVSWDRGHVKAPVNQKIKRDIKKPPKPCRTGLPAFDLLINKKLKRGFFLCVRERAVSRAADRQRFDAPTRHDRLDHRCQTCQIAVSAARLGSCAC